MPSSEVMKKFTKGRLHSGSVKGPVVTSAKQAIAIAASERASEEAHGAERSPDAKRSPRKGGKDSR